MRSNVVSKSHRGLLKHRRTDSTFLRRKGCGTCTLFFSLFLSLDREANTLIISSKVFRFAAKQCAHGFRDKGNVVLYEVLP